MSKFSYRNGRFFRDNEPYFVIAADYQYYRDRKSNWEDRLIKLQASGVELITFYIPWRHHAQLRDGQWFFDFRGETRDSRDLESFLRTVASVGLLMIAKPGPFVHSELNVGGLPDYVSPTFDQSVPPARRHHGKPAVWTYDASQLPAPLNPKFDDLVKDWLNATRDVLVPYVGENGPILAIQLNDETLYCTSNDPPWHIGYEPSGIGYYHDLMREKYSSVENYNRLHGTKSPVSILLLLRNPHLQTQSFRLPPGLRIC